MNIKNEIKSPSLFVKNLMGRGNDYEDNTPTDNNTKEPLKIDRITDEGTSKLASRDLGLRRTD